MKRAKPYQPRNPVVGVRLSQQAIRQVDAWAAAHGRGVSRSDVLRLALRESLRLRAERRQLTAGERQQLEKLTGDAREKFLALRASRKGTNDMPQQPIPPADALDALTVAISDLTGTTPTTDSEIAAAVDALDGDQALGVLAAVLTSCGVPVPKGKP